ncbi:MAG TPA: ATPase, T2SS/T4P/T4SS family [Pirellulaceae bacterium]|nr:ATPase, T2SS/T4P/T4SS family [Pirellulaceae bacterium]
MNRLLVAITAAALFALLGADRILAQQMQPAPPANGAAPVAAAPVDNWPPYDLPAHTHKRGPGFYISLWKVALFFVVFLLWCRTTDWVNRDVGPVGLPYDVWNLAVFLPFFLGFFLLGLFVPWFWLGFPLVIVCWLAPLLTYVKKRNSLVPDADKVMTKEHWRYLVANFGKKFGANIEAEKKLPHEKGPPVIFAALGAANEQMNQANLIEARQSPAYITLKEIVADATAKRAERVLFDYTAETVGMKYQIDGVWLDVPAPRPPKDGPVRELLDPVAAVMKKLANLNMADRKSKQEGAFSAEYNGNKYMCPLLCQGTATGERIQLTFAGKGVKFDSLEQLGMRDKMKAQLKELMLSPKGILVFTGMPAGGLSVNMQQALKSTDRLMRDFVAVGDKAKNEPDVENVELVPFNAAAGETPMSVLPKLILRQPDVLVIRELTDKVTLETMVRECHAEQPKLSITSIRAKDAAEALVRILMLKVPAAEVAPELVFVLNSRLVRKLCDKCKEAYEPSAELLTKLGIPAGRVQQLYRERQPLPPESKEKRPPCTQCSDIGYFGRTAIFELLVINDKIREALIKDPKVETIKKVAKSTGHRGLQEEGIALVALGTTSLVELQRVLKL